MHYSLLLILYLNEYNFFPFKERLLRSQITYHVTEHFLT